ncbi:hypothetical protein [Pedobacter chitinilyticus]|uniref:Uncharacterized protein n=1 Tax=Pedobacter chitinilyticus TaxID=2233776 RepID=A0A443Z1N6_9SPHI|nr:hypothetical protein [Pedobacter chitinilyticus]RWU10432.1 hypothetical protein DPV69_03570 [Pedobacter chitinilyticus]
MNKKQFFYSSAVIIACFITNLSFATENTLPVKSETTSTTSTSDLTPVSISAERRAHFNIIVQSNQTILSWSTVELKNGKYEIYRSDDSNNFVKIGEKTIVGNPTEPSLYIFHDEEPFKGLNHYKLVKLDSEGKNTEVASKKVFLDSKVPAILSANPTPKINRI